MQLPLVMASACCAAAASRDLPSPTNLRVDLMDVQEPPFMLVTATARPSFSFVAPDRDGVSDPMSHYSVSVADLAGHVAWDSGKQPGGAAVNIGCGAELKTGSSYTWSAQYWSAAGGGPAAASAAFTVGLADADWGTAAWLGGGDRQFKLQPPIVSAAVANVKLHIASPGGTTVEVAGSAVGDSVGVSLWADNQRSVHYFSYVFIIPVMIYTKCDDDGVLPNDGFVL